MNKIYKVRTGGWFHGKTYIISAPNIAEAKDIMKTEGVENLNDDDFEKINLSKLGLIASGDFHWLYN